MPPPFPEQPDGAPQASVSRPRGAAPRQRRQRSAPQGRRHGTRPAPVTAKSKGYQVPVGSGPPAAVPGPDLRNESARQNETRPSWDEDTRTVGLFDSALTSRTIRQFGRRSSPPPLGISTARAAGHGLAKRGASSERARKLGHLRRRLEASMLPAPSEPFGDRFADSSCSSSATGGPTEPSGLVSPHAGSVRSMYSPQAVLSPKAAQPPLLPWPAPEPVQAPQQLEVLHMQRKPADTRLADSLAILLPDGSALGSSPADVQSVLLMPGSLHAATGEQPPVTELKPPEIPGDKLQSLSQRLSALLQLEPTKESARSKWRPETEKPSSRAILRQCHGQILDQVDELADAVLKHVLGDTVELLNKLPEKEGDSPSEDNGGAGGKGAVVEDKESRLGLAQTAAQLAAAELLRIEEQLSASYRSSAAEVRLPRQLRFEKSTAKEERPSGLGDRSTTDVEDLRPASLPLERVRKLDQYRTRFAHHCLAAREAGIERGPEATKTATWVIWPHLADSIALAAIDAAIEEAHAAMEKQVEDMVKQEIGLE